MVQDLVKNNARLSGLFGSALVAGATYGGNEAIPRVILDKGADVNGQLSGDYASALAAVAYVRNEAIVRLLFDRGADVNNCNVLS